MDEELKILLLEDNPSDAELIKIMLQRAGIKFQARVASDRQEFTDALQQDSFHIILSDHQLPQFSSVEALELVKQKNLHIPFILVTGAVSEEFAVSIIQQGADDYLLKNNLSRLAAAIMQAIEKRRMQRAKELAEQQLRTFIEEASDGIFITDDKANVIDTNASACNLLGYSRDELLKMNVGDFFFQEDSVLLPLSLDKMRRDESIIIEKKVKRKDGTSRYVEIHSKMLHDGRFQGIARDISKRKKAEEELNASREMLRQLFFNLQNVREEERTRIAREIHDELGQQLTGLKMDVFWLNKKLKPESEEAQKKIKGMIELIDSTVRSVRKISSDLRPGILDDLGLVAALDWQSSEFEKRTEIECKFQSETHEQNFEKNLATGIFRIYQETLTNVARHAEATKIKSSLEEDNQMIILTINDNGKGFDEMQLPRKKTLGMVGMRERAIMMGGELVINSMPGKGTTTILKVPFRIETKDKNMKS